jgi:hypothetical protein
VYVSSSDKYVFYFILSIFVSGKECIRFFVRGWLSLLEFGKSIEQLIIAEDYKICSLKESHLYCISRFYEVATRGVVLNLSFQQSNSEHFYGEVLLAYDQTFMYKAHPFSAVRSRSSSNVKIVKYS